MNNLLIIGHIKCPTALSGMWTASRGLYGLSFFHDIKVYIAQFSILNRSHHRCRWATQLKSCLISEDSQTLCCLLCRGFELCTCLLGSPTLQWVRCWHITTFPHMNIFQHMLNQTQQIIIQGGLLLQDKHAKEKKLSRPLEHVGSQIE